MTAARLPIYMQIVDVLLDRVEQGVVAPGDRLAPERTLAAEFGVNRRTVRQALDVLAQRGLVERRQGSGTFSPRSPGSSEAHLSSSTSPKGSVNGASRSDLAS